MKTRAYVMTMSAFLLAACASAPPKSAEKKAETPAIASAPEVTATAPAALPSGSDIIEAKPASLKPMTAPTVNMLQTQKDADGVAVTLKLDHQAGKVPPLEKEPVKMNLADAISSSGDEESTSELKAIAAKEAHKAPEGTEPDVALGWLKNGNTRFLKGRFRKDGATKKDVARLAKGQKPHSVVFSCSDSRVPPEVVFDQKLGELFTVRSVGEALSGPTLASLEYAVEKLGTRLLVVMGHTSCGAVQMAAALLNGGDAGSPNYSEMVADIQPRIRDSLFGQRTPSANFTSEGWANTHGVIKDLKKRSPILAKAIESGRLKVVAALYHTDAGNVEFETK